MKYSFNTPHTIYWERSNPLPSLAVYTPYIKIDGQFWQIERTGISIVGFTYILYIAGALYLESTSLSAAMIKATEILRDLDFVNVTFKPKTLQISFSMCRTSHPIIGWKKAFSSDFEHHNVIVKLRVPEGTDCHLTEYKCRAQKAEILGVYDLDLNPLDPKTTIYSIYRSMHSYCVESHSNYQVGDTLVVDDFYYGHEICSTGIHFFRSPLLAIEYNY